MLNKKIGNLFEEENTSISSFILIKRIKKEKPIEDSFDVLSFKEIYEDNPYFKYIIEKTNNNLNENKNNENIKLFREISEFISINKITKEILEKIFLNGIADEISFLRPMIWKSLIGILSNSNLIKWKEKTEKNLKRYNQLKKENLVNYPNNLNSEEQKIIDIIEKDLNRTQTLINFLELKSRKNINETNFDILKRILFIYSKQHPEIKYIQGMNEIIFILYYIFEKDDNPFIINFVESDSYFSFETLMDEFKSIICIENNLRFSQLLIAKKINFIYQILESVDNELFNHFNNEKIQIETFIMKWFFVIFTQQFKIDILINLWDRIFTQKDKIEFLCFFTAAIFIKYKDILMKLDFIQIMNFFQNFGEHNDIKDINDIINKAIFIQNNYNSNYQ